MRFRRGSQSTPGAPGNDADSQQSRDAMQQALRSLSASLPSGASVGSLSPEALAELARRAGLTSPAQMGELARLMGMNGGVPGVAGVPQHIFFMLADTSCALPAGAVQSVERITEVTPIPNTVPWVLGVVQVWGAIISVVDLRQYFGLPAQPITMRSRLLVVSQREMTIGFLVDAVTEMRPLGANGMQPVTERSVPEWAVPYTQGVTQAEGRSVALLDPERLLFADKMHRYRADG